jgi:hypothetical protein
MFNLGEFSMKKTLVAIAALAAVSAFAQSSVSINGGMRIGYGSNTTGAKGLVSNQNSGNTINVVVVEDLGGGLAAEGAVQFRYDLSNGVLASGLTTAPAGSSAGGVAAAAGAENTRLLHTTRLGLKGGFGAIQLGRIGWDQHWGYTAFGSTTAGVALNPVSAYGATDDNQIRYISPNLAGFQAHLGVSTKNNGTPLNVFNGGTFNGTQIHLSYANGPLAALLVNEKLVNGSKGTQVGASYNFGVAKVNLIAGSLKSTTNVKLNNGLALTGTIPLGAATVKLGYKKDRRNGLTSATDTTANAIGVDYALSKRTVAEVNTWKATNNTKRSFWVGMKHSF